MNNRLKKMCILVMASIVLGIGNVYSQEQKKNYFVTEANVGYINYVNYPALSFFEDNTSSYLLPMEEITFGYRWNNFMLGVQWQYSQFSTSNIALKEVGAHGVISLLTRSYKQLGDLFEVYSGFQYCFSMLRNNYSGYYDFSELRYGMGVEFDLGVNLKFNDMSYIGFRFSVAPAMVNFSNGIITADRPGAVTSNVMINNYSLSLTYALKF